MLYNGEEKEVCSGKTCSWTEFKAILDQYIVSDDELEDDKKNGIYKFKKEILDKLLEN